MVTLKLTDEQVIDLVNQLPPEKQTIVLKVLITRHWPAWEELSRYGEGQVRQVCTSRGRDWDTMTEAEREQFVDDLVHEDRSCAG